jgi:tape measure domain-containing protein
MAVTADRVVVELEARLDRYEANVARAETRFDKAMNGIQRSAKVTEQVVSRAALGMATAIGSIGFIALGKAAVDTALRFRRFEQGLAIAVGSTEKAGEEIRFLRDLADSLGLRFVDLAENFTGFAAAARGTNLEGEKSREIFEAITKAIVATGGSTEQLNGALLAVQQMVSKGNVQAEELRGQLGERLPGAFQIAARAMGVTTAELDKMLEKGDVAADVFLPKFAAQLGKELPNALQTADASFQRFQTALDDIANSTADGFMRQLGDATDDLTKVLKDMQASGALEAVGSFLGTVIRLGAGAASVIGDLALAWRKWRLEVGIRQQQSVENGFLTSASEKDQARKNRQALERELELANNPRVAAFRQRLESFGASANNGKPLASAPAASSGSTGETDADKKKRLAAEKKAAREAEQRAREAYQNAQEDRQIQIEVLRAQSDLTDNIEAKAQFEREMLEIERQQRIAELAQNKELSAEQRKARMAAINKLYGSSGQGDEIIVDGGGLLPRAVMRDLQKRLEDAANMQAEAQYDIAHDALAWQERMAGTREERQKVQLELLNLEYEERRRQLEFQQKNATSQAERDAFQTRIDALGGQMANDRASIERDNEGPLARYRRRMDETSTQDQVEELITQELDYVRDGIRDSITKRLGVKDPFLAGLIDIFINKNIIEPFLNSMRRTGESGGTFGNILTSISTFFQGSAGGGETGTGVGFASGGTATLGGRGGTDRNTLSPNGRPIANVTRGETLSVGSKAIRAGGGNQPTVYAPQFNLPNAVVTTELYAEMARISRDSSARAAGAAYAQSQQSMPGTLNKFTQLKGG